MRTYLIAAAFLLAAAGPASAQEPSRTPLTRADTHFVIGWQNLHKEQPGSQNFNNWVNGIFYGGAGAGWYWTDHLKTQVDFGAGTEGHQYRYEPIIINGQTTGLSSRFHVRQQSVAVSQQYQFFRNQWFHPHLGAGVDIARETTTEEYAPILVFDSVTRTSRQLSPPRDEGPEHRVIARPFGEAGFKAYMTRRSFFTADTRLMYRKGLDEVLFRLGFGIDF
jgi:opacity protein-like surface antigen